jgi:glycine cleavage system aminomethyltransferase T/ketosteroid isomerase-like protein
MTPTRALHLYCDAFRRRAPDEMATLFADDAVLDLPLNKGRISGADAIVRTIRAALLGLKSIRIDLVHVIESGSSVSAEGVFYAEQVGVPPHVDGSPQRLDFKFVVVVEVAAGKISRWTEYFDTRPLRPRERVRLYPITRRSPYWEGSVAAGVADFMVYNHTYFPLIHGHSPAEEYVALTERVTLWDVACERQTELWGADALRLAELLTTRDISTLPVGGCKYTLVCDPEGRIMCDPVLLRPWDDVIWLSHGDVDLTLWARGIALGRGWDVEVREPDVAPLQIQGPRSVDVLRPLVQAPIDELGFYKCTVTRVAGIPAVVSRTGWSGGLGYEVFPLESAQAMHLWRSLEDAGRPYDMWVTGPNINRAVEKGVTDTSYYSNSDLDPFEAGHARLVDLGKGEFIGREALRRTAESGPKRATVGLRVDGDLPLLEWYWPIEGPRGRVGEVRWACHSFALDCNIAIAVVDAKTQLGDRLSIVHPLGSSPATVVEYPFV